MAALCLAACGSAETETPAEAIESIATLYRIRDYDALVRTRYAEIGKAENEEQIQALIDRFKTRFEDTGQYNAALEIFAAAMDATPEISEGGLVATYRLDDGELKLWKLTSGKWGFHL